MLKIKTTEDGSDTIFVPDLNEHYHSVYGAITESEVIYINSGFNFCTADPVRIFEAGLGTGLNALLTAVNSLTGNREVFYTAIEKFPLSQQLSGALNYPDLIQGDSRTIFEQIHGVPWNIPEKICRNFTLHKIKGDLITDAVMGEYDLIYFDAFGPDKQPEMWTSEVFRKIGGITAVNGILVTYSVKGEVKRHLGEAGFTLDLLPGPPGKRHILRAVKI
jgi:tRNA U34 5-methylaminomethyl-2-thiouridine-forming methyltransferase MnmC